MSKASEKLEVTDEMIKAGASVLWSSGVVEGRLGSDNLLVEEIFRAMVAAQSINPPCTLVQG